MEKHPKNPKALLYCSVWPDEGQDLSLESQSVELQTYCLMNGLEVVDIISDVGPHVKGKLRTGMESHHLVEEHQHTLRLEALLSTARTSAMASTPWRPSLMTENSSEQEVVKAERYRLLSELQKTMQNNKAYRRVVYAEWYELVMEYNCRCITVDSDVLAAVSGIASYFHHITGDNYLAGLWADDLPAGLLWTVDSVTARAVDPSFGMPSWSWAAVRSDTLTMWYLGPSNEVSRWCVVGQTRTIVDNPNPFGSVVAGFIQIRGARKQAIAMPPVKRPEAKAPKDRGDGGRGIPAIDKMFRYVSVDIDKEKSAYIQDCNSGERVASFFPDWCFMSGSETVSCLTILQDRDDFGEEGVVCLVIVPHTHGSWRRVGFTRVKNVAWFEDAEIADVVLA